MWRQLFKKWTLSHLYTKKFWINELFKRKKHSLKKINWILWEINRKRFKVYKWFLTWKNSIFIFRKLKSQKRNGYFEKQLFLISNWYKN